MALWMALFLVGEGGLSGVGLYVAASTIFGGVVTYFLRDLHLSINQHDERIKSDEEILELVNGRYIQRQEMHLLMKGFSDALEGVEHQMDKAFAQSKEHYTHEQNTDAHWTKRERDESERKFEAFREQCRESFKAIQHEIKELGRRRYGDT